MLEIIILLVGVISVVVIVWVVNSFVKEKKPKNSQKQSATFSLTAEHLSSAAERKGWQENVVDDVTKSTYERLSHIFDMKYGSLAELEKTKDIGLAWEKRKQKILKAFRSEVKGLKTKSNTVNKMSAYDKYPGVNIYWRLGLPPEGEEHCSDCTSIAAGAPYNKSNPLPSYPGDGNTKCLSNCYCTLWFEKNGKWEEEIEWKN